MNEKEAKLLKRYHHTLLSVLQPNLDLFASALYQEDVIDRSECKRLIESTNERKECVRLLLILPDKCTLGTFLEAIHQCSPEYFQTLQDEFVKALPFSSSIVKLPVTSILKTGQECRIEKFRDLLLEKVQNAEVFQHENCLRTWLGRLLVNLKKSDSKLSLRERRCISDLCFVVSDALTVVERTHSPDKSLLWKSELFTNMKKLMPDTSNPSLSSLRYFARYGAALALGDKKEQGKEYVETAMEDAIRISRGRELGNCMFALVNIKLQDYDWNEKEQILEDIELGLHHILEDCEGEEKWRYVYLDKKLFCHLGINTLMNDVLESNITENDISVAFQCLNEMEKYTDKMDKRRKMHFLRARSRYHYLRFKFYNQDEELCSARGDLEAAINIGTKRQYVKEVENMKIILECNFDEKAILNKRYILSERSSKEPTEDVDYSMLGEEGKLEYLTKPPNIIIVEKDCSDKNETCGDEYSQTDCVSGLLEVFQKRLDIPTDDIGKDISSQNDEI